MNASREGTGSPDLGAHSHPGRGIRREGPDHGALRMMCLLVVKNTVHLKYMHKDLPLSGLWGEEGMSRWSTGNF